MANTANRLWAWQTLQIVIVYCLTAKLGISAYVGLAPVTAIWPPTGIALTALLVWGNRSLLGILLGAILFNLYNLHNISDSAWVVLGSSLSISFGSTLQTLVAAVLIHRYIPDIRITKVGDTLRFSVCIAVSGLIAASIGCLTLLEGDRINQSAFWFAWSSWWVGDVCGMLIITPLILVARYWWRGGRDLSMLAFPIIGIGFGLTLIGATLIKHIEHQARTTDFANTGVAMGSAIQRNLNLALHDLRATQALFYNAKIHEAEFRNFTEALMAQNQRIYAYAWLPYVKASEREQFERSMRVAGRPWFHIFERDENNTPISAGKRKEYFPLQFIAPEAGNSAAIGFDNLSDPKRRSAMQAARASGDAIASAPTRLLQDSPTGKPAYYVYWAVYEDDFMEEERLRSDQKLRGYVGMAFRVEQFIDESIASFENRDTEIWIFDTTDYQQQKTIYSYNSLSKNHPDNPPKLDELRSGIFYQTGLTFAGREWLMIIRPADHVADVKASGLFFGILLAGGGFTFILAIYMIARQRAESELRERDERLLSQNAVLTQLARYSMTQSDNAIDHLRELTAAASATLKVERVSYWQLDETCSKMECLCLFTLSEANFESGVKLDATEYPRYFATLNKNRGFAVDDAQNDPRTNEFSLGYLIPLGITSMLDVPVRTGGKLVGVICHEHVGPKRQWAADEQNFAGSVGDLASLILESHKRAQAEDALQAAYSTLEQKVTERTEELRQANERLRQLDQLKSMFIASMSHELRTPLNSIIGFTGVVLQGISGPLTARQQDQLNRVYGSARHLLSLITDVIDISKIEAGYVEVYAETFSVNTVIEEALATVQPQRLEKNLGLEVTLPPLVALRSDRKRLLQCVLNLLSNAIKYSEQGKISVRVVAEWDRVLIEVSDTGIGIAPAAMERLFQPFERIDTHLRIKTLGTGLGLYLTRKIVSDLLHGGISAHSVEGQGSTFTLWLPFETTFIEHDRKTS